MRTRFLALLVVGAVTLFSISAPRSAVAAGVVGTGTPESCSEAAFTAALQGGGAVTFNCGAAPHTISISAFKTLTSSTSIDGGGRISLSGAPGARVLAVPDGVTLNLTNITLRDTGAAPFAIGVTLENRGTTNLVNTTFLNNNTRAILNGGGTLTIASSRFEGNSTSGGGGAISNESGGTVTITASSFVNNRAPESQTGGAIYNSSNPVGGATAVTINRSTFSGNSAGNGGAIISYGTMTIADSLFTGNTAIEGGAIQARSGGQLNVTNTTISGNSARRGGGFQVTGPLPGSAATLTNVTLANNTAPGDAANQGGGNLAVVGNASVTLRNTILANPAGGSTNCRIESSGSAAIVDGSGNLQFPGVTCGATITSANPQVGALQDNGGFTATHAIAANSPARDTAVNANCPAFDQRGVTRPQGTTCDIGAVEYNAVPVLTAISPLCGQARGSAFTLTVGGLNFIPGERGTKVVVNGTALETTFVSPTQLTAVVPAGFLTGAPGSTVPLIVRTDVVDGGSSAILPLTVCQTFTVYLPLVQR